MATNHPFLGIESDFDRIIRWFEETGHLFHRSKEREDAVVLHFFEMGRLLECPDGQFDQAKSPLIWVYKPRLIRRSLWTSGAVVFTPTPLKDQFPEMYKINRRLSQWLREFPLVYKNKKPGDFEFAYYLEGGIKNWVGELYALPLAYERLRQGQYFVHYNDGEAYLDRVCRYLRLRGVDVEMSASSTP